MSEKQSNNKPETLLYSRQQTASLLGISERKLHALTVDRESGIVSVKIGTRRMYPVDELREWIEKLKRGGSQ